MRCRIDAPWPGGGVVLTSAAGGEPGAPWYGLAGALGGCSPLPPGFEKCSLSQKLNFKICRTISGCTGKADAELPFDSKKKGKQIEQTTAESQCIVVQDNSDTYNTGSNIKSSTNDLAPAKTCPVLTKRIFQRPEAYCKKDLRRVCVNHAC